ncbi:MAG: protein kinase [Gemmatimonadales bacterium]|nr:protein kinase [Gemmatimonadales bacterium]
MEDLRPRLEKALADQYVIERELGGGGMSRTYLAREKAFDRRVVIKVLAPELLAGISVERFRREILLAAQLQHPHVVPVLTAGDVGGLPWFTMPYVDGNSLRYRLGEGPLRIAEVLGILRDVARALAYAHQHGIVHRDIKPDNVLLSSGSATVTDFGIAKAISAARGGDEPFGATLTVAGTSIGTPTYMAPEQAAGDPGTNHRSDLYSFGVMAYEMLAGQPPFHGLTPTKMLAAQLGEKPKDVRTLRSDCPEPLAELVMRCLEKDPDARPQQAGDVARVLDNIASSGTGAAAPSILAGGRIRFGKAIALWAGATALVALTAWAATDVIGLPDWVFPGSLGVMLAGLPVILTTWYVQRAVHRAYTATPQFTPGGTNTATHGTMHTLAIKASPHFSWRRAWLGGGIAVGGFALLVLSFMVMRAAGIGPFASLRGTGAFGERETLVVADFVSPPGDSALGATIAEALRTDLAQSRAFQVLTRANLRDILRLMRRDAESSVLFDLAREIATREGAKAVLDGGIEKIGSSYVVSARLVGALDGADLRKFRVTARNEDELLEALGKLSREVRAEAGESFKSIRASSELERVTTPSLAALRKYVEGSITADEKGDSDRGLALLQEAVTIDTAFAMAWRKISVLLGNEGRERSRALASIETAYKHRDRLSETERYLTEGYYFTRGPHPDRQRALTAYEAALRLDSLNTSALNNSGVVALQMRQFEKAEEVYRRVTMLPRTFGGAFTNLIQMQVSRQAPYEVLDSTRRAFYARFPESGDLWEADWWVAFGTKDFARADSVARAARTSARTLRQRTNSAGSLGATAELRGRPREAYQWYAASRAEELRASNSPANRLNAALDTAYLLSGVLERTEQARTVIARALARNPMSAIPESERPWRSLALLAVRTRDPALARTAVAGAERDQIAQSPDSIGARAWFAAHRLIAEERYADALPQLQEAERRFDFPSRYNDFIVAQLFDLTGQRDSAIAKFEAVHQRRFPTGEFDADYLARSYKRLGELYEAKGDTARAIRSYESFVDMWKDAEPELQPQVTTVRNRLARLRPPG